MPSTASATLFSVSTTADSGAGSLRDAITEANNSAGADTIDFVGAGEGTISPLTALPASTGQLGIDGGRNGAVTPVIVDGSALSGTESGLQIAATDSQVAGLVIQNFPGNGIDVTGGTGTAIENNVTTGNGGAGIALAPGTTSASVIGNEIGVDATGTVAQPNGGSGILVRGSGHQIGSATSPNVISGNGDWGIDVAAGNTGSPHLIRSNFIGTDVSGTSALPNTSGGVLVEATAPGTRIGGSTAGQGNVLSGNTGPGVRVSASTTTVAGNTIGLDDATKATAIGNGASGVEVQGSPAGVVIGGIVPGAMNLISGNGVHGVSLGATVTQVIGNRIGTDGTGSSAVPNTQDGVYVSGANNRIGVSGTSGAGTPVPNLISGNSGYGIEIDSGGNGTIVQANKVGTDDAGTTALPNGIAPSGGGVLAREAVTIGGSGAGTGNLVSGNDGPGISLDSSDPGQSSTVLGNTIGLPGSGAGTLQNNGSGIGIAAATHATIGGAASGAGNLISGNLGSGIASEGTGVQISGNRIGVAADGTTPAGNTGDGIALGAAAQGHLIGGATAANGNLIAYQTGSGISDLSGSAGNQIAANSIFANGVLPIDQLADGSLNANDAADAAPPQNSPTITSALTNTTRMTVRGTLQSAASKAYVVRFFSAAGPTPDGTDMRTYLGSTTVQTNASGIASFNVTLGQPLAANRYVTATATSPQKNTSERGAGSVSAIGPTVQIAPTSYSVLESDRKATIIIRRTGSTAPSVTVHYATVAGTAHGGSDFTPTSGTATIPAGATSTSVVVPIIDDSPAEPRESFTLKIDSPVRAVLGSATTATVTIDDDAFGTATRVALVVAKPFKATPAGVVKVGVKNSNLFKVTGTLRVLEGTRTIGSHAVSVAPGTTQQVSVQLSAGAIAELRQKGQIKATLSLLAKDGDGHQRTVSQPVTIVRG